MGAFTGNCNSLISQAAKNRQENERAAFAALIDYVVDKAFENEGADRPQSAEDMRRNLSDCLLAQ